MNDEKLEDIWDSLGINYQLINPDTGMSIKSRESISDLDRLARLTAAKASGRSGGRVEWDDAYMDCLVHLSERPEFAERLMEMKLSHAANTLWSNIFRDKVRASSDCLDRGARISEIGVDSVHRGSSNYTEDEVAEMFILHYYPIIVDNYTENVIDDDMPRAAPNPAHKHTSWARMADLNRAFKKADLTLCQKQAAFLMLVVNVSASEAGKILGKDHKTVAEACDRAIEKITNVLNGKDA